MLAVAVFISGAICPDPPHTLVKLQPLRKPSLSSSVAFLALWPVAPGPRLNPPWHIRAFDEGKPRVPGRWTAGAPPGSQHWAAEGRMASLSDPASRPSAQNPLSARKP